MSRPLALLTVLSSLAALAEPASLNAMIWGGGATQAEASASLAGFTERQKSWSGALTLARGFPQIVESKDLPGLKPGFVVVLLGYCADADAPGTIELLKLFDTAIYVRPVKAAAEASCPKLSEGFARADVRSAKTKDGELQAAFLTRRSKDSDASGLFVLLQLHARAGGLLEAKTLTTEQLREIYEGSCELSVAKSGVAVALDCVLPQGCPVVGEETGEIRFRAAAGKIEAKAVTLSSHRPPCAGE